MIWSPVSRVRTLPSPSRRTAPSMETGLVSVASNMTLEPSESRAATATLTDTFSTSSTGAVRACTSNQSAVARHCAQQDEFPYGMEVIAHPIQRQKMRIAHRPGHRRGRGRQRRRPVLRQRGDIFRGQATKCQDIAISEIDHGTAVAIIPRACKGDIPIRHTQSADHNVQNIDTDFEIVNHVIPTTDDGEEVGTLSTDQDIA